MARVTVEDCVVLVPNRFDLVMLSAHRARALASGAELKIERDRDKNPVVALREIAEEKLDLGGLTDSLIKGLQKRIEPDQPEEEIIDLMAGEQQNWINADMGAEEGDDAEEGEEELEGEEADLDVAEGETAEPSVSYEDAEVRD